MTNCSHLQSLRPFHIFGHATSFNSISELSAVASKAIRTLKTLPTFHVNPERPLQSVYEAHVYDWAYARKTIDTLTGEAEAMLEALLLGLDLDTCHGFLDLDDVQDNFGSRTPGHSFIDDNPTLPPLQGAVAAHVARKQGQVGLTSQAMFDAATAVPNAGAVTIYLRQYALLIRRMFQLAWVTMAAPYRTPEAVSIAIINVGDVQRSVFVRNGMLHLLPTYNKIQWRVGGAIPIPHPLPRRLSNVMYTSIVLIRPFVT